MTENIKAELYLDCLDRILAGGKDIRDIEDDEVGRLLQFAKNLITVDFSIKSEIKDNLRQQLLNMLSLQDNRTSKVWDINRGEDVDELSEEELSLAAAGLAVDQRNSNCGLSACCPYNKSCTPDCFLYKK